MSIAVVIMIIIVSFPLWTPDLDHRFAKDPLPPPILDMSGHYFRGISSSDYENPLAHCGQRVFYAQEDLKRAFRSCFFVWLTN